MAFVDDVTRHAEQIRSRLPHLKGEEATKHSLVIPLLNLLGWDPFDPREVTPEYTADFAVKRNGQLEKIDYAVCVDGAPGLFVECKAHDQLLEDHTGQLSRYFNSTPSVRLAVLTNGVRVRLFTDLVQTNVMDAAPWIEVDLLSVGPIELEALRRLRKTDFNTEEIAAYAERTVYFRKMADYMAAALREPSEAFVRFVAGEVFPQVRLMPKVVERLTPIFKDAIQSAVLDRVAKSFSETAVPVEVSVQPDPTAKANEVQAAEDKDRGIETTADELDGYEQICSIVRQARPDAVLTYRDTKTYFSVNQRSSWQWFIRFNLQKGPFWLAFRHVTNDDLRILAPGMTPIAASFGDSRVALSCPADVQKLRAAIIAAYDREAARKVEELDGTVN